MNKQNKQKYGGKIMKKISLFVMMVISIFALIACGGGGIELPKLDNYTETRIKGALDPLELEYIITYENSDTVGDSLFIRYEDKKAGDKVDKNAKITVVVSKTKKILVDLTGKTETEIKTILNEYGIEVTISYETSTTVENHYFIRYDANLKPGDKLDYDNKVTVIVALNELYLPDLSGKNKDEIINIMTELGLEPIFEYETSQSIEPNDFIRYGEGFNVGDDVPADGKVSVVVADAYPKLPNLEGKTVEEATALLDNLLILYEISYFYKNQNETTLFAYFGESYEVDTEVPYGQKVPITFSQNTLELPDLTGKDTQEIFAYFNALGISVTFQNEFHINTVEDQTFYKYLNFEIGEPFENTQTLTVLIGFNDPQLPALLGLNIHEIKKVMEENYFYNFSFNYVEDDSKEADTFKSFTEYEDEAFIEDPSILIEIDLYTNSFLNDEKSLLFSKILENGGSNQYVEIYNATDQTVDLSKYSVAILANGQLRPTKTIQLTGTLESGETFGIVNSNAPRPLRNKVFAGKNLSTADLSFDGNDTIQLRYVNETYVDSISTMGTSTFYINGEIFIRTENVLKGNRHFSLYEWDGYVPTYYDAVHVFPIVRPTQMVMDTSLLQYAFGSSTGGIVQVTLSHINDGDTAGFDPGFSGGQRVRFLGVDTPETYPEVEPWGLEAKAFTTDMLNAASTYYLQSDPDLGHVDTYGRSLAYIWVDGIMINYEVIKNGFSLNYLGTSSKLIFANRYIHHWFADAEEYARINKLGIHS